MKKRTYLISLVTVAMTATTTQAAIIADWQFTSGSELVDSSASGNTLVAQEVGSPGTSTATFNAAGYVSFSGGTTDYNYFTPTTAFGLDATDAWSLELVVRDPGSGSGSVGVLSSNIGGGSDSWQLNNINGDTGSSDISEHPTNTIGSLADNDWHTVLLVHEANATTPTVFFDGVEVTLGTAWAADRVGLNNLGIGSNRGESQQASVDIDSVRVWDTAIIPEPSSLALLGLSASELLLRRRRN